MAIFKREELTVTPPIFNADLNVTNTDEWEDTPGPNFVACVGYKSDVTLTVTGFWGRQSEMQITCVYTGAYKVGTTTFTSTAENIEAAVDELNAAAEQLMVDYLPTQGWQLV